MREVTATCLMIPEWFLYRYKSVHYSTQFLSTPSVCEIYVLPFERARGKPSYPISMLICANLATGSVAFIPMDDAKMGAI